MGIPYTRPISKWVLYCKKAGPLLKRIDSWQSSPMLYAYAEFYLGHTPDIAVYRSEHLFHNVYRALEPCTPGGSLQGAPCSKFGSSSFHRTWLHRPLNLHVANQILEVCLLQSMSLKGKPHGQRGGWPSLGLGYCSHLVYINQGPKQNMGWES